MRAAYLNAEKKIFITAEGLQLVIIGPQNKIRKIPAKLLNVVYTRGKSVIDSSALCLLTRANVPLIISGSRGIEAIMLPYNHKIHRHYREQRIILKSRKNLYRYLNWLERQKRLQQIAVMDKFSHTGLDRDIGEGDYQIWLKNFLERLKLDHNQSTWCYVRHQIRYLFRGLIVENLLRAKLDIHLGGYHRRVNFGLVLDLNYVLDPRIDEQTILFFSQKGWPEYVIKKSNEQIILKDEGFKNIVHRFENKKINIYDILESIIDDYLYLVRELRT